jgi:flavin reductase (DIM6/NTAB) family NADH-FMN oxidoreductase RutF
MEMSTDAAFHELFVGGVTSLASGVAVVTARRTSGNPCGLAATAITSYTAHPPSLLVSIAHVSRCHDALASSERFGVHLLRSDELALAHGFADREAEDKFDGLEWAWDGDVPELGGTLAYLRRRRASNFARYDHTIMIGDLEGGRLEAGDRCSTRWQMDWLLRTKTEWSSTRRRPARRRSPSGG